MSKAIQIHPKVAALAKRHGFSENIEMGGAYLSRDFGNGRTLLIGNGEADYPETPDSECSWSIQDENGNVLSYGNFFSFRELLKCEWIGE